MPDETDHEYRDDSGTEELAEDVADMEAELEAEIEALAGLYDQQEAHIAELEAEVASLRSGRNGDGEPSAEPASEEENVEPTQENPEPEPAGDGSAVIIVTDERPPKPRGWLWRPVGESRVPLDTERKKEAFWAKRSVF